MVGRSKVKSKRIAVEQKINFEDDNSEVCVANEPFGQSTSPVSTADCKIILEAIKEIKLNNKSITRAAKFFNIPESNLLRYIEEFDNEISEISFIDDEDLLQIVQRIATKQKEGKHIFSINDLCVQGNISEENKCPSRQSSCSSALSMLEPMMSKTVDSTNSLDIRVMQAIKCRKLNGLSIRAASLQFNIPKTSITRYFRKFDAEVADIRALNDDELLSVVRRLIRTAKVMRSFYTSTQFFSSDQEKILAKFIRKYTEENNELSLTDLRKLIYKFACEMNLSYPLDWKKDEMAKVNWCADFMKRHLLNIKKKKQKIAQIEEFKYQNEELLSSVPPPPLQQPNPLLTENDLNIDDEIISVSSSTSSRPSSAMSALEPMRKRCIPVTTFNGLYQAIRGIRINNLSVRAASIRFNVPKTSLARYIQRFNAEVPAKLEVDEEEIFKICKRISMHSKLPEIFSDEEEELMLGYIKHCLYRNGKLNVAKFRSMAYQFARDRNIAYPSSWDRDGMVGRYWYYTFAKKHSAMDLKKTNNEEIKKARELLKATTCKEKSRSIRQSNNKSKKIS